MSSTSKKREVNTSESTTKKIRYLMDDGPDVWSKTITIRVGNETKAESFIVHEGLIRESSAFFDHCLHREWKEAKERIVRLPYVNPIAFKIYVKWLYSGKVFAKKEGDLRLQDTETGETEHASAEFNRWDKCYQLGDFLQDGDFKDALIDASIEHMIELNMHYADLHEQIYRASVRDSPVRKLAVDTAFHHWDEEEIKELREDGQSSQFLADLLFTHFTVANGEAEPPDPFEVEDTCIYHEHTLSKKPCYKSKRKYWF